MRLQLTTLRAVFVDKGSAVSNLTSAKMPLKQNAMAARRDAAVEPNGYTQEAE